MSSPGADFSPTEFSTRHLAASDQFDAWRAHYREVFDLGLEESRATAFDATHRAWELGGLTFTQAMMPDGVGRRWRHWQRPDRDDWIVVVAPGAEDRGAGSQASHVGFRSLARPFEGAGRDGHVLSLFLPRDQFHAEAEAFDAVPQRLPNAGMAGILGDFMLSLDRSLPLLTARERDGVVAALKAMVVACFVASPRYPEGMREAAAQVIRQRACRYIRQHLSSPGLNPAMIAAAIGVSRSSLYRAFEPHGGVVAHIQRERLDEAYRRLAAGGSRTISAIAWDLGYADPSTFARAFKRRFGHPPRDLAGARVGVAD